MASPASPAADVGAAVTAARLLLAEGADVARAEAEVGAHRSVLRAMDIRGRIYICSYGINAQLSGPRAVLRASM